ncbi:MAG: hypothetical protein IH820_08965 [Bacteroidetes bacterium]|nr:hypothetical protein [Bacteroidota bacterium]
MKMLLKACVALAGVALLALPDVAYACEKCFGAGSDETTVKAIFMSMLALFGMVTFVWGGIGLFFINMRRRAKMLEPGNFVVTQYGDLRPSPHDEPGR